MISVSHKSQKLIATNIIETNAIETKPFKYRNTLWILHKVTYAGKKREKRSKQVSADANSMDI